MRPDPGRHLLDERIATVSPESRVEWTARKRELGFLLVWQQSDAAGPMTELERAMFILDRLYPEMPRQHREQIDAKLTAAWDAGRWHGFQRPPPLGG